MTSVRAFVSRHRTLALLLLLAALCLKSLIPAGYMVTSVDKPGAIVLTVALCDGDDGHPRYGRVVIPMADEDPQPAPQPDCAWSMLAMASLAAPPPLAVGPPPVLRPAPVARPVLPLPARHAAHLRPPLRGPPLSA